MAQTLMVWESRATSAGPAFPWPCSSDIPPWHQRAASTQAPAERLLPRPGVGTFSGVGGHRPQPCLQVRLENGSGRTRLVAVCFTPGTEPRFTVRSSERLLAVSCAIRRDIEMMEEFGFLD